MLQKRKARLAKRKELDSLQSEVMGLRTDLDELYARFDMLTAPTQMDACIYEMNALMSKYDYAVKCLKAFDGTA